MLTKIVHHLLRQPRSTTLLQYKPLLYKNSRNASNKDASLAKSTRTELDTNVKPLGEKLKETTTTVSYLGVILIGVGVTGALFYAVFSELFSSKSPNSVYAKTAKRCINDPSIQDRLGLPIKSYGEETRRGRRRHVTHLLYEEQGRKRLRMQFYLQGAFKKGTVHLEMMENDLGKYEYRYLFVEINDILQSTIVLEDNRQTRNKGELYV